MEIVFVEFVLAVSILSEQLKRFDFVLVTLATDQDDLTTHEQFEGEDTIVKFKHFFCILFEKTVAPEGVILGNVKDLLIIAFLAFLTDNLMDHIRRRILHPCIHFMIIF